MCGVDDDGRGRGGFCIHLEVVLGVGVGDTDDNVGSRLCLCLRLALRNLLPHPLDMDINIQPTRITYPTQDPLCCSAHTIAESDDVGFRIYVGSLEVWF